MRTCLLGALAFLLLIGCDDARARPAPTGTTPTTAATIAPVSPADEARDMLANRCAMCHGSSGKGDGPTAMTLNPKPRDFTNRDWQKATSDAQLKTVILKGGSAIAKSPLMPPNPDLESKPEVVSALVVLVRAYGK